MPRFRHIALAAVAACLVQVHRLKKSASVLAVGPGKLLDDGSRSKPDVAVGDVILFGKYSGTELTVDGLEVIILKESDILAKIG